MSIQKRHCKSFFVYHNFVRRSSTEYIFKGRSEPTKLRYCFEHNSNAQFEIFEMQLNTDTFSKAKNSQSITAPMTILLTLLALFDHCAKKISLCLYRSQSQTIGPDA